MNFTFENQGTNTYLVYTVGQDDVVDNVSLGMITNNKIPGLASTLFMQMDEKKYIKYNVTSKVTLKQFFSGAVNKKRLIGVFSGIAEAMLSAEEYMINTDTILLDCDYIFVDVTTCNTYMICLPIAGANTASTDLVAFFKNIMFNTQFDQSENCDYVAKIINYLNSSPVVSLSSFQELLQDLSKDKQAAASSSIKVQTQAQPQPQQQPQVKPQPQVHQPQVQPPVRQPDPPRMAAPKQSPAVNQPPIPMQNQKPAVSDPMQGSNTGEQEITLLDLLMHYNKEKAKLYKAQKAARKAAAASREDVQKKDTNTPFSIPGQPAVPQQPQTAYKAPVQPAVPQPQYKPAPQPARTPVQPVQTPVQPVQTQVPSVSRPAYNTQPSMNFGETTVLGSGTAGETTVLNAEQQNVVKRPYLVRMRNNEKVMVDKPVFRIGKERSYVDYFISDNTAISRSHANIISRDGEYFIVDTNSTNHTYVNGMMIQSNIEVKIDHNTKIKLANEEFMFYLY